MSARPQDCSVPVFRPMHMEDIDAVMALERDIYPFPWTRGNFSDSLTAGYSCWVYAFCDAPIGYGILMMAAGEAHLLNLGIARDWQRQGLGRKFLAHLIQVAQGYHAETLFLEVRPSNIPALRLYAGMGFNEIAVRRNYYPAANGREDAIMMGLTL